MRVSQALSTCQPYCRLERIPSHFIFVLFFLLRKIVVQVDIHRIVSFCPEALYLRHREQKQEALLAFPHAQSSDLPRWPWPYLQY